MRYTLTITCALGVSLALAAHAGAIDFETQASGSGGFLTGIPDSPLTIGNATFTGGELLNGEVGLGADQSGVYATEGLFGSGETNPLEIVFAAPVSEFSIQVLNAEDSRAYTVSDNIGDTVTRTLPSAGAGGQAVIALPGIGITAVEIASANTISWDYAVDNVTFTPGSPGAAPEPSTLLLLLPGLAAVALREKRLHRR